MNKPPVHIFYGCLILPVLTGTLLANPAFGKEPPDAKRIFNNNCAKCHGRLGKPTRRGQRLGAPDFTSRFWQVSITDEQIIESITYGKNKMPSWRHELTPEEIRAAARWVRVLGKRRRR